MKEFVTRNLGQEVFERLIEPFCSGEEILIICHTVLEKHCMSLTSNCCCNFAFRSMLNQVSMKLP